MTSGHFIYIPLVVLAGMIVGFILGGRAARDSAALAERRDEQREARHQRRAERENKGEAPPD